MMAPVPVKTEKKATASKANNSKGPKKINDRWDVNYVLCKAFCEKEGHCRIPTRLKENKSLGIWVQEQRRNFKQMMTGKKPRKELTPEQIEKLNEIDFYWGFIPDLNKSAESDASWEANFVKLQAYKKSKGDFNVPLDESESLSLAKWTRVQRNQNNLRATKRKCFISKERIKKLDAIGFNWDGSRKIE
jgi:hypothetical protein